MKKLLFITLLSVSLFSVSCTKDTGGNANISTVDFTVTETRWNVTNDIPIGQQGYGYYVDLVFPEITENVIRDGMVTLYMKRGDTWTSVPFNYFYQSSDLVNYQGGYFYSMQVGTFSIDYYESDHKTLNPGTQIFRLVIVQPR